MMEQVTRVSLPNAVVNVVFKFSACVLVIMKLALEF